MSELDFIEWCNMTREKLGRELKSEEVYFLEWIYHKHRLEEERSNNKYPIA